MPALLSRHNVETLISPRAITPAALLVSSVCAYVGTPVPNSLLTSAIAWSMICVYTTLRLRRNGVVAGSGRRLAWFAGGLLSLGAVCERSVDGRGIWWAHVRKTAHWASLVCYGMLRQFFRCLGAPAVDDIPIPTHLRLLSARARDTASES